MSNVFSDLETIVGSDYISDAQHVRWTYSRDVGIFPGHLPDIVIKPQTTPKSNRYYDLQIPKKSRFISDVNWPVMKTRLFISP